ncbi:MAG: hypothetical protein HY336_02545 [Candidatus Doudnabacteria bacterium]|nr:hypothetical protein [Candidatus Doudnabacteria bacterium]
MPENEHGKNQEIAMLESLKAISASIEPDPLRVEGSYVLTFPFEGGKTTIRIALKDQSGDLVITNMTTLPDSKKGKGHGSDALGRVLAWANEHGLQSIRATQVQKESENFWAKNGFEKDPEHSQTNDFVLKPKE